MSILFTVRPNDEGYEGFVAVLLREGANTTEEYMAVESISDAKKDVLRGHSDAQYVSPKAIAREIANRSTHTEQMLSHLIMNDYESVGLHAYTVYGAMRPTNGTWARVPDAVYLSGFKIGDITFQSFVAVPDRLNQSVIDTYELHFISRPA